MEEIKKKKKNYNSNNMASMSSTTTSPDKNPREELITTSTISPPWKLYENPFYNSQQSHQNQHHQTQTIAAKSHHLQCLQLPHSARRLAASFWDLSFFRPVMPTDQDELGSARAQIAELKTELEYERKARKKLESMNKKLAKEAAEERRRREAMERMCEDLAREISSDKSEIAKMRRDMEEERKMMRVSEVLREERVQMKLADAKIVLEEKLSELDTQLGFRKSQRKVVVESLESMRSVLSDHDQKDQIDHDHYHEHSNNNTNNNNITRTSGNSNSNSSTSTSNSLPILQKKLVLPEIENPHIKRGIQGLVEFPRVVRAIGSRNKQWGTKLECQKAQLRILLRQNGPIRSSSIIS